MPLLQIGEVLIDGDEADYIGTWDEVKKVTCPKCESWDLEVHANYCSNCGQKVTWFTKGD